MTTADTPSLPLGTPVLYWPGAKRGPGRKSATRSDVWLVGGTPVVAVEGHSGGIALTHIEVIPPATDAGIRVDLDDVRERYRLTHVDASSVVMSDRLVASADDVPALAAEVERLAGLLTAAPPAPVIDEDARQALALHLWDMGIVRPEAVAREAVDAIINRLAEDGLLLTSPLRTVWGVRRPRGEKEEFADEATAREIAGRVGGRSVIVRQATDWVGAP